MNQDVLACVVGKVLGKDIVRADYKEEQLHGGTLGDVRLVSGTAETADGERAPYKVVWKLQKKWNRFGDPLSWRREYDLYASDLGAAFNESLRWPICYHAEIGEDGWQIWMEFVEGVSGVGLTIDMMEKAAEGLGRFQGRLHAEKPDILQSIANLSALAYMRDDYRQWKPTTDEYRYIRTDDCAIPPHLCQMLIRVDSEAEAVFGKIARLPVVLCQRDFWIENIIHTDDGVVLIDWDTAGWGYLGEDIASLIVDDIADADDIPEYYRRLVPAYYRGVLEHADVSFIEDNRIWEMMLFKFGYRFVHQFMFAKSDAAKNQSLSALQKLYEIKCAE